MKSRMFVASLSLFAIYDCYILQRCTVRTLTTAGNRALIHSSGPEGVGLTYKNFFNKLNIVICSPLHIFKIKTLIKMDRLRAINKFLHPAL